MRSAPESLFWYWIAERHAIYLRKQAGQPKPWTTDPILQRYKFTNPFRQHDRGTEWLTNHFLEPHDQDDLALIAFNICWYRMFNWTGTGELLGWQDSWDPDMIKWSLHKARERGEQVFTGAHIVYSPPGRPKIDAIVDVCTDLWNLRNQIELTTLHRTPKLESTFNLLRTIYCVGGFMAYEMVTDMRHTRLLEDATDIMTWANMGPGARRGLMRLGLPCGSQEQGCESMQKLLLDATDKYYNALGLYHDSERPPVHARPVFEMRDIEHSLCEFDKYCRVKFGEGEPRSKYNGVA